MSHQDRKKQISNALIESSNDSAAKGALGEEYAREFLRLKKFEFAEVTGNKFDKPAALTAMGGKRPDFVLDPAYVERITGYKDEIWLFDAKLHKVAGGFFSLPDDELTKYKNTEKYLRVDDPDAVIYTVFLVFIIGSGGTEYAAVSLDEILNGKQTIFADKPARCIDITSMIEKI